MIDIENIEKLKIFGRLLIWKSNNKIHVKDFDKPDEHGTVGFVRNGIIDIHRKNEKTNTYRSEGILDLKKFVLKLSKDPLWFLNPLMEMAKIAKIVNFDESEFSHLKVMVYPSLDSFPLISKRKNKEIEIPENAIEIFANLEKISWKDCKNKKFQVAMVYDNELMIGFIQRTEQGAYMFILLNDKTSSIKDEIEKKWFNLEPTNWNQDRK